MRKQVNTLICVGLTPPHLHEIHLKVKLLNKNAKYGCYLSTGDSVDVHAEYATITETLN